MLMNKFTNIVQDYGWVHPLAKTLPSFLNNFWWNVVMDDWNVDANQLVSGEYRSLQHFLSLIPRLFFQGMTYNVGLAFSVSDTTQQFKIMIKQNNQNWWH